jgi:hypothetical protein
LSCLILKGCEHRRFIVRDFANALISTGVSWGLDESIGGVALAILVHPEAQALLVDATFAPKAARLPGQLDGLPTTLPPEVLTRRTPLVLDVPGNTTIRYPERRRPPESYAALYELNSRSSGETTAGETCIS